MLELLWMGGVWHRVWSSFLLCFILLLAGLQASTGEPRSLLAALLKLGDKSPIQRYLFSAANNFA